jgi:prevent-host-death family protein
MKQVSVREAKKQLSKLLRRVAAAEEISITNRGVPVPRLVPLPARNRKRSLGAYGDTIKIADDFDAPLPDEILDAFEECGPPNLRNRGVISLPAPFAFLGEMSLEELASFQDIRVMGWLIWRCVRSNIGPP